MEIRWTEGGVTAPKGFRAAGIHCGIKNGTVKNDLALICSDTVCSAAGLFTKNRVKAAPVKLDISALKGGKASAVIANSGNANACAPRDMENAEMMRKLCADALGIDASLVLVGSTGVIGQELNIAAVEEGVPRLKEKLTDAPEGSDEAARAIMTTDTKKKELAVCYEKDGKTVTIGGIAKGSGMIHPNMGTMLCYLTTDAAADPALLKKVLTEVCGRTFNRISVDGDTSTNDSLILLAGGGAGLPEMKTDEDAAEFREALMMLCTELARRMAADGEGAKHLITCTVSGCENEAKAETLSKSVIGSALTKAAIFGCDANWGRILCALGYSGTEFDPEKTDISFASGAGVIDVCKEGRGLPFDEELAAKILKEEEVEILVKLHEGNASVTCWGCDLTYDYVRINGDYRT